MVSLFSEKGTHVYEIARSGFLIFLFSFLFVDWTFLLWAHSLRCQMGSCQRYYPFCGHLGGFEMTFYTYTADWEPGCLLLRDFCVQGAPVSGGNDIFSAMTWSSITAVKKVAERL